MDDVLNNLVCIWNITLNKVHKIDVKYSDIDSWNISKPYHMLTTEQIYEPLMNKRLWNRTKPVKGSQDVLKQLVDDGHKVYIATATHYKNVEWKIDWLKRYFPFIDTKNVIVIGEKQLLNIDLLCDDAVHNLVGGSYRKLLMSRPWNEDFDEIKHGIIRVHDFDDIEREINKIAKENGY